jgi:hypothetical protein
LIVTTTIFEIYVDCFYLVNLEWPIGDFTHKALQVFYLLPPVIEVFIMADAVRRINKYSLGKEYTVSGTQIFIQLGSYVMFAIADSAMTFLPKITWYTYICQVLLNWVALLILTLTLVKITELQIVN